MTDLRTHWSRTSHEALCGLTAKRLLLGERIISGEYSHDDVTCPGCRAVLRTAWHPIETAPRGEWVEVWGTLFRCDEPGHHIARLDSWGWGDRAGIMIEPTHYRRLGPAHLPAAPEAPHV